jgi:hypothetical protein
MGMMGLVSGTVCFEVKLAEEKPVAGLREALRTPGQ